MWKDTPFLSTPFFQLVGTCCLPGYLLEAAYQPVHLHYNSLSSFFLVRLSENMFSPKTQVFVKYFLSILGSIRYQISWLIPLILILSEQQTMPHTYRPFLPNKETGFPANVTVTVFCVMNS